MDALIQHWLDAPTPPRIGDSAAARRYFRMLLVALPAAALIHAGFAVGFYALGSPFMAVFNICAVLLYAFVVVRVRKTGNTWYLVPALFEVMLHAAFASLAIGWASSFHLYLLVMGVAAGAVTNVRDRLTLTLLPALAWVVTRWWTSQHAPWTVISDSHLTVISVANFIGASLTAAIFAGGLSRAANQAEQALAAEHARSEALLHNVLPPAVAQRLKDGPDVIADRFDEASVLFSDLVGFTELSARVSPAELVRTLNEVFSAIDELVAAHGLEKIKTIGDAYMVASGIPTPRSDHLEALTDFALELLDVLDEVAQRSGVPLRMRVGIHTGPVVAGVIGRRKFAYDLWGDTVNTAARMESHGEAGRVHASAQVARRLGDAYRVDPRGRIEVKGKGPMETVFILGRARP